MSEIDTFETLLTRRHSCRAYLERQVPEADIKQVLTAAGRVPSWCNAQPWQVIVTSGAATERFRTALFETASSQAPAPDLVWPKQYTGAFLDRRRACGFQLYDAVGITKDNRAASTAQMMQNFALFGAPHVAIITTEADLGPYGAMDCGGYVTAFTLAAEALGIASIPQAAVASHAPLVRAHFDIPESRHILCAISFGYADKSAPINSFRTERAPLDEIADFRD